jgi:hypothetical protein
VFIRREDADQFIAEVRGDDAEVAAKLRSRSASSKVSENSTRAGPALAAVTEHESRPSVVS